MKDMKSMKGELLDGVILIFMFFMFFMPFMVEKFPPPTCRTAEGVVGTQD